MSERGERTALLLVDLQKDFLERAGLTPDADAVAERAAALLRGFRARDLPIAHSHTVTRADGSDRMPHWKRRDARVCVDGSEGAQPPASLAPAPGELVCRKQYYSAFSDPRLDGWLREHSITQLVVAGLYLHACVRTTALDAYERGYQVCVAEDGVATTEPLHGELTRAWLEERAAEFRDTASILAQLDPRIAETPRRAAAQVRFVHRDPCRTSRVLGEVALGGPEEVAAAARTARAAQPAWAAADRAQRADWLERWAAELDSQRGRLTELLIREVAKPRRFAEEEVGRTVTHIRVAAELARASSPVGVAPGVFAAARPVGVVGLVTPWNNPLAIPVGKIAPALAFGNAVVLKPAPQACETAFAIAESLERAGLPAGLVNVVPGGRAAARAICREPGIAAVSVTGSFETGRVLAMLCAEAMKPLQAELGGNNAAIVLADADLERSVPELARAAFGFTGQRCTAIRRFVVEESVASRFEALMVAAVRALRVGEPDDPATDVGPLISVEKRDAVVAELDHARRAGAKLLAGGGIPAALAHGAWLEPALLADADPGSAIAQRETFGPVALLQVARDLEHALVLANGVAQGLVLSVHTRDERARARVLEAAQAGIVQASAGPLAVHPRAPFSGWKASGLGPPEHGVWDAAFYARTQAVYGEVECSHASSRKH